MVFLGPMINADGIELPRAASFGFIDVLASMIVVTVTFAKMGMTRGFGT
jgi:hypothetical protein